MTVDRIAQSEAVGSAQPSTFFAVCCSGCGGVLGRMYTAAPPALARALHKFALAPDAVTSYALGSAPLRAAGGEQQLEEEEGPRPSSRQQQDGGGMHAGGGGSGAEVEELRQQVELMSADILQASKGACARPRCSGASLQRPRRSAPAALPLSLVLLFCELDQALL